VFFFLKLLIQSMSSEKMIHLMKYLTPVGFSLLKVAFAVLNSAFCR